MSIKTTCLVCGRAGSGSVGRRGAEKKHLNMELKQKLHYKTQVPIFKMLIKIIKKDEATFKKSELLATPAFIIAKCKQKGLLLLIFSNFQSLRK